MECSNDIPKNNKTFSNAISEAASKLQIQYSWCKNKATIVNAENPKEKVYLVDFRTFAVKSPAVTVKSAVDGSTVGTGTLHPISSDVNYEIRGRKGTLKAMKQLKTGYTYPSYALSEDDKPVSLRWVDKYGLTSWDLLCMDEQSMPIAKISTYCLKVREAATIEFMGPVSPALRDELIVTGVVTLWMCMSLRSTNIFSLVGAVIARPGKSKVVEGSGLKGDDVYDGKMIK